MLMCGAGVQPLLRRPACPAPAATRGRASAALARGRGTLCCLCQPRLRPWGARGVRSLALVPQMPAREQRPAARPHLVHRQPCSLRGLPPPSAFRDLFSVCPCSFVAGVGVSAAPSQNHRTRTSRHTRKGSRSQQRGPHTAHQGPGTTPPPGVTVLCRPSSCTRRRLGDSRCDREMSGESVGARVLVWPQGAAGPGPVGGAETPCDLHKADAPAASRPRALAGCRSGRWDLCDQPGDMWWPGRHGTLGWCLWKKPQG